MNICKRCIFISDLHLQENAPEITHHFLTLLKQLHPQDSLFILGDLFEYWIGDDEQTEFITLITKHLKQTIARDIKIYLQHGNRDFFIGKRFLNATGCTLLPDEMTINVFGTSVLLLHGDTLCTQDKSYQYFRKFVRHPFTKFLYNSLPLSVRRRIVLSARNKSQYHVKQKSLQRMDVVQNAVINVMQKYQAELLIHGHTHQPGIHHFLLNNKTVTRIVLEAWHPLGAALVWDEIGQRQLQKFT